jgi:hypothetical protein
MPQLGLSHMLGPRGRAPIGAERHSTNHLAQRSRSAPDTRRINNLNSAKEVTNRSNDRWPCVKCRFDVLGSFRQAMIIETAPGMIAAFAIYGLRLYL